MASKLTGVIQPAQRGTALAFILAVCFGFFFLPGSPSKQSQYLNSLIHLTSLSIWIGTQFWVTFVAGLTMIKVLPRIVFGEVQSHLFSKYFFSGSVLSIVVFATFFIRHPLKSWADEEKLQGLALLGACVSTVANYLLLEPMTTRYMFQSHRYQKEHGKDGRQDVVSETEMEEEWKKDETYRRIRSKFMMWHGLSAAANLVSFAICGFRLWHLSKQLVV